MGGERAFRRRLGRTGVRALAAVQLRAWNRFHRLFETYVLGGLLPQPCSTVEPHDLETGCRSGRSLVHQLGSGACPAIRRSNKPYVTTISSRSVFPKSMRPPKPNSVEPPWYGPVCPVVWEGWRREASPYPDLGPIPAFPTGAREWQASTLSGHRWSRR